MFVTILKKLYLRDLAMLRTEIELYKNEENIWYTEGNITNSAGNLCLHLVGNVHWRRFGSYRICARSPVGIFGTEYTSCRSVEKHWWNYWNDLRNTRPVERWNAIRGISAGRRWRNSDYRLFFNPPVITPHVSFGTDQLPPPPVGQVLDLLPQVAE